MMHDIHPRCLGLDGACVTAHAAWASYDMLHGALGRQTQRQTI